MEKIDITHTTKPTDRPHPEARLIRDLTTGVADWEIPEDTMVEEVPDFLKPTKSQSKRVKAQKHG